MKEIYETNVRFTIIYCAVYYADLLKKSKVCGWLILWYGIYDKKKLMGFRQITFEMVKDNV